MTKNKKNKQQEPNWTLALFVGIICGGLALFLCWPLLEYGLREKVLVFLMVFSAFLSGCSAVLKTGDNNDNNKQ